MSNTDLDQKMNAILNSDYSLENKIEQLFFDLKPTGKREEKISFILYWINQVVEKDGQYEKITYFDIAELLNEILDIIDATNDDYTNYYGKINVVMNKIMNEIITKTNNKKQVLEPSSLIRLTGTNIEPKKEFTSFEEKAQAIKKKYAEIAEAEIERLKMIEELNRLTSRLSENDTKIENYKKEIDSIIKS